MPTFHPAYLLRNPKDKALVWEDIKKVTWKWRKAGKDKR
jgi:uracil-DNA glycosylase